MKTIEEILEYQKAHRVEDGEYGLKACKECIEANLKYKQMPRDKALYEMLCHYVYQTNVNIFFNSRMVLACWELINQLNYKKEQTK